MKEAISSDSEVERNVWLRDVMLERTETLHYFLSLQRSRAIPYVVTGGLREVRKSQRVSIFPQTIISELSRLVLCIERQSADPTFQIVVHISEVQ